MANPTAAAQVSISRIATETLSVPIIGTSPLIVHKFSEKARRQSPRLMRHIRDARLAYFRIRDLWKAWNR